VASAPDRPANAPVTGISLLIEWVNQQDHWIRALAAEIIEMRRPLSEARVAHFLDLMLREKELASGEPVVREEISAGSGTHDNAQPLVLTRLVHKENVNALAANQEIEFNPRMTLLFGENASGKTGYVRILKRAAAVRTAEPILPDIRTPSAGAPPRAILGLRLGSDDQPPIEWRGEQGMDPLTRIDVFDSRAAVVHLEENLTYAYTPADLALFPLIHDGLEKVRAKLDGAQRETAPKGNPFAIRFPPESRLMPKIEVLGSSTDLRELEDLAQVSEVEEASLPGLREKVEALRSGNLQARFQVARREQGIYSRAADLAETLRGFDHVAHGTALRRLREAEAAHARATQDAFAADALPGVLGDEWRAFIEASEDYIQATGLEPYPAKGTHCIYCRQPLGDAAVALVQKYRDFRNDALRAAVETAKREIHALTAGVSATDPEGLREELQKIAESLADGADLPLALAEARTVAETVKSTRAAITAGEPSEPPSLDLEEAGRSLRMHAAELARAADDLRKQGEDRRRALDEESAKLRDIEDRLALRGMLPGIRSHVEAAIWADRAGAQLRRFQGIKRGITETSKHASARVLDRDFGRRFADECEALRAPRVTLDFPGREGEARRRKLLAPGHGVEEILSEGEQKVIALADFLAEGSLKRDRSPIVLDDPVTSLDHKRLQHVVDRLVDLSRERQVIVFTHDIWFAAELLARFEHEARDCAFYDITSEDGRIGTVARGSHPRTDTFKDRSKRVQRFVDEAAKESGEIRQALIERGYSELRGACEIVVETDLLGGVTQRYRPNVRMSGLDQIRPERLPAAFAAISPVFERCCRTPLHSQPLVTLGVRPTLENLKQDWETLRKAREDYLK
jgi:hypothetical protein